MRLHQLDEYKQASNALSSQGERAAYDLRMLNLPAGKSVEDAFEELNAKSLSALSERSQTVIRTLARRLTTHPGWVGSTIVLTRIGGNGSAGLHLDDQRMNIWALAVKPGARTFTLAMSDLYRKDEDKWHLLNLMGFPYPAKNPRNFFLMINSN